MDEFSDEGGGGLGYAGPPPPDTTNTADDAPLSDASTWSATGSDEGASYEDQSNPADSGGALGYAGPPAPKATASSDTAYDQPTAQNTAPLGYSGAPSSTDYSEPDTTLPRPSRAEQSASYEQPTETPEQSLTVTNAGVPYFAAQDQAKEKLRQDVSQESGSLNGEWDDLNTRIDAYNNGGQYDAEMEGSLKGELADLQKRTDDFKNRPNSYYNDRFDNPQMDGLLQNYTDAANGVRNQQRSDYYTQVSQAEPFPDTLMTPQQGGALGADMLFATNPSLSGAVADEGNYLQSSAGIGAAFVTPSGQQVVKKDDGSGTYSTWTIAGADNPQNVLYQDDKGNWTAISRDDAQQLIQQGTSGSRFTSVANANSIAGDAVSTTGVQPSIGRTIQSAAFAASALALPVNPGDALLAGVAGEGASAIPGIGIAGLAKFNGPSFVANAILNGLPEHVPGTNVPIPDFAQHPLGMFLDNPTGIIDTVRKAVIGAFNPQAPEVNSLVQDVHDAFTQPNEDYWRQRGIQDAGFGSLLVGGLGLHNSPDGLLGFVSVDPHNTVARYQTIFANTQGTPEQKAQAASQGIQDTVGNLIWTLNPWNPAYSWVTSPLLEKPIDALFNRSGQRTAALGEQFATAPQVSDALLNRADQVAASLSRNPFALSVPQAAEQITQMVADRAIQVPASRVQEFVQDFYSLVLKVEEDQTLNATAGVKYLGPMGLTNVARQMAEQMADKWATMTGPGYLSLAGSVRDGFAATVPAAGNLAARDLGQRTGSTVGKAIEQRMGELMALAPASPAVREYTYRAGSTAAQVGNDVLIRGAIKDAITQDVRRYYYDLAGITLPADRSLAQNLVNEGVKALGNAVRASFLVAGAPAIALQKILDEAFRASTQGVWGIFGVRPADMAVTRAFSRFASERGMGVGDYLGEKSAVNRYLGAGILPSNNLLRDSQANGFWQGLRGISPYGEQLTGIQRAAALNPIGMANRAVDKFLNSFIQSPTQHIILNAANKAYIEQAGGMKNIVETVIDRMNTTPGIASEDLVRYTNQLRAARSMGEFKGVLDDYTARYGSLADGRGSMGGNGIPQPEPPPPATYGQSPLYDLDNPPPPQPGTTYNQSPLFRDLPPQAPSPDLPPIGKPLEPPPVAPTNGANLGSAEAGTSPRIPTNRERAAATDQAIRAAGGDISAVSKEDYIAMRSQELRDKAVDYGKASRGGNIGARGRGVYASDKARFAQEYDDFATGKIGADIPRSGAGAGTSQPLDTATARANLKAAMDQSGDPLAQWANGVSWFHGSTFPGLTPETLDTTLTNRKSLYGHGIYLTDSDVIANNYAMGATNRQATDITPTIYNARTNVQHVLDMDAPAPPEVRQAMKNLFDTQVAAGAIEPHYASMFDIKLAKPEATSGDLVRYMLDFRRVDQQAVSRALIGDAGYDALKYNGGVVLGGDKHNVLIVLDPTNRYGIANGGGGLSHFGTEPAPPRTPVNSNGAKANGATKLPPLGRPLRPAEKLAVANQGIENDPERYIAAVRGRLDSLPPEIRNYALNNYRAALHKSFDPLDQTALRLLDENEIRVPYAATDEPLARQAAARQGMGRDFDPGGFSMPHEHLAPGTDVGASLRPFEGQSRFQGIAGDAPLGHAGPPPLTRTGQYGGPRFGGTPVGGGAGAHRFDVPLPPPTFAQGRFPEQPALFGDPGEYTQPFTLGRSGPPPVSSGPAPFAPNTDVVNANANRALIGQAGADYTAAQRAIPQRAQSLADSIIGNPNDQTNIGSALRNGQQIKGWSVLPAVLPFANFHIHTTQFWLRFFAEHPVMPVMIAKALQNAGIDDYGQVPTDAGGKVGGVIRMSTAGHLMDWALKAQQYYEALRANPNGNSPIQQIEKNVAYNTLGNNAFIGAFPEETGLGMGVVQSTTNPLQKATKSGLVTDPRDMLKERGSENFIEGGLNLAGVPRPLAHAVGGTGNSVSNLGMNKGVDLVNALGGSANLAPYNSTNQLPFVAPALAKTLGWDTNRTAFAVAAIDRWRKDPQAYPLADDGQALMDAYQHMQDVAAVRKVSPITNQSPDEGNPIFPADNSQSFLNARGNAGTGGVPYNQDTREYDTARNQLNLPVNAGTVPTMDYARDFLGRVGVSDQTMNGQPSEQRTARAEQRLQSQIEGNAKYTGAGLPQDQRLAKIAQDETLQSSAGPNGFTGGQLLNQEGNYYSTLDKIKAANDAGDKAGAARLRGELAGIIAKDTAQDPALKSLFDQYATKAAAADSPEGKTYAAWNQQQRDAYDAFNDLRNSADYKKRTALEGQIPDKATDPRGYSAWFKANGTELASLNETVYRAEQAIIDKTGYNPKQIANQMVQAEGRPATYATTDITAPKPFNSAPPSSTSSGGRSAISYTSTKSSGRSASTGRGGSTGGSAASTQKAGDDFFAAYRGLTPTEKQLVRKDTEVAAVLVSGVKHTEQQYTAALDHLKSVMEKSNNFGRSPASTEFRYTPTRWTGSGAGLTPDQLARGVDSIDLQGREKIIPGFAQRMALEGAVRPAEARNTSNPSTQASQSFTARTAAPTQPLGYSGVPKAKAPTASTYTSNYGKQTNRRGR